eukprot:TRINITY_DN64574_c0_g1_i1.p1 TRINITY_DN64574_c0_g1~~TRINITY_DN64574_c0_g1_i1.p1  ORF type:complete len:501 (+),score=81.57 TRINITY_DN64574_c0_g1_i1:85-1587(+)
MASRFGSRWIRQVLTGRRATAASACAAASASALALAPKAFQHQTARAEEGPPLSSGNMKPFHLATWQSNQGGLVDERKINGHTNPMAVTWPNMNFVNPNELVAGHIIQNDSKAKSRSQEIAAGCVRGNACREIYWEPTKVKAALVTCGGLCPGLNSIIREVTNCLWYNYGVEEVIGMTAGYNGLSDPDNHPQIKLNPDLVREIHMKGGSILKAGRGGFDAEKICDNLEKMGINMLFVIGGDGTQSAGALLYQAARKRNLQLSIVGIPKSIDNDVLYFDKTFGFDSSVAEAQQVIRNGWVEATSCDKGVGIVKLMGRDAGFVAMHAALASTIVDLVLIPEVKFNLDDVLTHVSDAVERKGFCVVAVAEGAGQEYVATGKKDATGHAVYGDIGVFLKDKLNAHLKPSGGRCFYIDPSYIIRSCPIRPNDHIYCGRLASDAVHTAMRGYTGVCVGPIHNIIVILPSKMIAAGKRKVNVKSSGWQSCVQSCKMPMSLSGGPVDH